jgi:hypothetical protein
MTSAPWRNSTSASARPMPRVPPVINTFFIAGFMSVLLGSK